MESLATELKAALGIAVALPSTVPEKQDGNVGSDVHDVLATLEELRAGAERLRSSVEVPAAAWKGPQLPAAACESPLDRLEEESKSLRIQRAAFAKDAGKPAATLVVDVVEVEIVIAEKQQSQRQTPVVSFQSSAPSKQLAEAPPQWSLGQCSLQGARPSNEDCHLAGRTRRHGSPGVLCRRLRQELLTQTAPPCTAAIKAVRVYCNLCGREATSGWHNHLGGWQHR